jgi:hypothetical protein
VVEEKVGCHCMLPRSLVEDGLSSTKKADSSCGVASGHWIVACDLPGWQWQYYYSRQKAHDVDLVACSETKFVPYEEGSPAVERRPLEVVSKGRQSV